MRPLCFYFDWSSAGRAASQARFNFGNVLFDGAIHELEVDASRVAQGQRSNVAAPRQLGRNQILAGNPYLNT